MDKKKKGKKSAEPREYFLVLKPSDDDPLLEKKKMVLESKGFDPMGRFPLKNTTTSGNWSWLNSTFKALVETAKVVSSDEVELYFSGTDADSSEYFCNPTIELEAFHKLLSVIDETRKGVPKADTATTGVVNQFRNATIGMIQRVGNKTSLAARFLKANLKIEGNLRAAKFDTDNIDDKGIHLLEWGESNGVQTKLGVAYVEGAGRGAIATEDLQIGDIAMEIPLSVIISEDLVHESDMFSVLKEIDAMSSETMALLWSMKERHNKDSKFKLYFDALPEAFNTGLSFGTEAIMALDETLLREEIVQAKEHLRRQYDELVSSLCNEHPDIFPAELFTWEHFLWACELWCSNSMKVMFTDGKLKTCLVPIAGFLNHSICPHIIHYGKVDPATGSLKFPMARPCKAGEQCYLSYGKFSSSHLVTFYGFVPEGDIPYDIIPFDVETEETNSRDDGSSVSDWTNHMVRGTWLTHDHGLFHYGLPTPLLDLLRKSISPIPQTKVLTLENLKIEFEILQILLSIFEEQMDKLADDTSESSPDDTSWDVKLARKCKDIERSIVSSVLTACHSNISTVEHESSKFKN